MSVWQVAGEARSYGDSSELAYIFPFHVWLNDISGSAMLTALADKKFYLLHKSRIVETPFLLSVFRALNHWEPKHHPNSFCICD